MTPPITPKHPEPDQEVGELPGEEFNEKTVENMDLNPELYDDECCSDGVNDADRDFGRNLDQPMVKGEEETEMAEMAEGAERYVVRSLTEPFDELYEVLKYDFDHSGNTQPVASHQQSRLVNYIDEEILKVQRKFKTNQASEEETYLIFELLRDLNKLIDLVWYSITKITGLFGQEDYLIRIAGDMGDYLALYLVFDVGDPDTVVDAHILEFFTFFQNLDLRLSFLIDGFETQPLQPQDLPKSKLSATQVVRLNSIIYNLRPMVIAKIEPLKLRFRRHSEKNESDTTTDNSQRCRHLLDAIDVEIGRVFEGLLERFQADEL